MSIHQRWSLALAAALTCGGLVTLVTGADETVKIDSGTLAGTSSNGVRIFKGIPYAAPPIGDLRWKAPQPAARWTGVRNADAFGAQCPQLPYPADSPYFQPPRAESEDCLFLNVWTAGKAGDKRPVMVWLHGGGLTRGSGSVATYDGSHLANKGLVIVTINYRLGVLGFLAHPELTAESPQHVSGNYGALDQIAALKWVQKNIAAFGGDPGNVTIFGESAGSTSVNTLVASPLAKGLFHRAIGESGGRFGRMTPLSEAERAGAAFAKAAGADSIKALRARPADELVKLPNFQGGQIVDGAFLPDEVRAIYAQKKHNAVPVIVGSNADEMTTLTPAASVPKTLDDFKTRVATQYGDLAKEFDTLYPAKTDADVRGAWLGSQRDAGMTLSMRTWARMTAAAGGRAYLYWFSHVSPHPNAKELGAYHASEIAYVFGNLLRPTWNYTDADRKVAETMSSMWANFAKTGDPNGAGLPKWAAYDAQNEPYMDFSDNPSLGNHLRKVHVDFMERAQSRAQRPTSARQ